MKVIDLNLIHPLNLRPQQGPDSLPGFEDKPIEGPEKKHRIGELRRRLIDRPLACRGLDPPGAVGTDRGIVEVNREPSP